MSVLFGFLTLNLMTNQVATGLALTILGLGLSGMIGEAFIGQPGISLKPIAIPGLSAIRSSGRCCLIRIFWFTPLMLW